MVTCHFKLYYTYFIFSKTFNNFCNLSPSSQLFYIAYTESRTRESLSSPLNRKKVIPSATFNFNKLSLNNYPSQRGKEQLVIRKRNIFHSREKKKKGKIFSHHSIYHPKGTSKVSSRCQNLKHNEFVQSYTRRVSNINDGLPKFYLPLQKGAFWIHRLSKTPGMSSR